MLIAILGMFFMVSSNDLLFYLGLELQSLSLYILASIDRDNLRSSEAGIKYFVLSALSSGLLLYGCSLLYGFTGSTNFQVISNNVGDINIGTIFAMIFILVGLAFKVSAVPFHMWTPGFMKVHQHLLQVFCYCSKNCRDSSFYKIYVFTFPKYFRRMAIYFSFYIYCFNDFRSCCSNKSKKYKEINRLQFYKPYGYAIAGISTGTESGFKSTIIYILIYSAMNIGFFAFVFLMKRSGKYIEDINELSEFQKTIL